MNCAFKNNCKLKDSEYCSEFCERYVKLKYLFSSSLIPESALEPTALFVDSDGSDRDSFVYKARNFIWCEFVSLFENTWKWKNKLVFKVIESIYL